MVRFLLCAAGLLVGLASGACEDSDGGTSAAPDGGGSGASGRGGAGRDGQGAAAGQDGEDGESGASGDGEGAGESGDFDSYWKRKTSAITVIDPADPFNIVQETLELPAKMIDPIEGREVDLYIQLKDDTRYAYAYFTGDEVYYRMATALTKSDDVYFDTSSGETHIYELDEGRLTDTSSTNLEMLLISTEATFEKLDDFPPADWPSEMVETPELAP